MRMLRRLLLIASAVIVSLPIEPAARGQTAAASQPSEPDAARIKQTDQEILRLYRLGRLPEATELTQRQVDIRSRQLGPEHSSTLDAMAMLALLFRLQDRYSEAEAIYHRVLAIKRRVLGDEHPDTLALGNNLAALFMAQGKLSEAEPLYRQVLKIRRRVLGDENRETLISLHNLAMLLRKRGSYAEAEPLFLEALNTKRRVLGEEDESTLTSVAGLAVCFCEQGRYSEAEPLLRQILQTRRNVFGDQDPRVADSLNNLGILLQEKGDYATAETMHRQALEIRQHTLGNNHSTTVGSKNNLASVLKGRNQYAEAEALYREALEANRRRLGEENPGTLNSKNNLASVLVAQGKDSEAESLSRTVLETRRKVLGDQHQDTLRAENNLATLLCRLGRAAEAEPILRHVLAARRRLLGDEHPDTAISMNGLARLLYSKGQSAEAEQLWSAAAAVFESARLRVSVSGLERSHRATERSPLLPLAVCLARQSKRVAAWQRLEANLARGLFDAVHAREVRPLTTAERQREGDLVRQLAELDEQRRALSECKTPAALEHVEELRWQCRALQAELVAFEKTLEKKYGPAAGAVCTLPQIQARLPATTAMVGWVDIEAGMPTTGAGGDHWACVLRHQGEPIWMRLAGTGPNGDWTEDDKQLPLRLREALSDPEMSAGEIRSSAAALYSQRLKPLESHLSDVRNLVVLSFGSMAAIPVEALTDTYTVSYAPSATMYTWLAQKPRKKLDRLLALGDPPFNESQLSEMRLALSGSAKPAASFEIGRTNVTSTVLRGALAGNSEALSQLPRLRATRPEALAIAQLFDHVAATRGSENQDPRQGDCTTLFLGLDASEQSLATLATAGQLRQFDCLHFATHVLVDDRQQALILSQVNLPDLLEAVTRGQPVYDGRLSAVQVVRTWTLDAELVTLSACRTALGRDAGSMGHWGFSQAFLVAGARSLLLSLWEVDDSVTALMMVRFYQNLLGEFAESRGGHAPGAEMPKAEALREARQWLRGLTHDQARTELDALGVPKPEPVSRGKPGPIRQIEHPEHPFEHPHYWAGFILVGKSD